MDHKGPVSKFISYTATQKDLDRITGYQRNSLVTPILTARNAQLTEKIKKYITDILREAKITLSIFKVIRLVNSAHSSVATVISLPSVALLVSGNQQRHQGSRKGLPQIE